MIDFSAHLDISEYSPHLKTLNLVSSTKYFCAMESDIHRLQGLEQAHFLGGDIIQPTILLLITKT